MILQPLRHAVGSTKLVPPALEYRYSIRDFAKDFGRETNVLVVSVKPDRKGSTQSNHLLDTMRLTGNPSGYNRLGNIIGEVKPLRKATIFFGPS